MNKLFKKMYAVLGVLVMLLPIALSAVSGSVKAEGEGDTKNTQKQTVILTKLGFSDHEGEIFDDASKLIKNGEGNENYNPVAGVNFKIYDVTTNYYALKPGDKVALKSANEANFKGEGTSIGEGDYSTEKLIVGAKPVINDKDKTEIFTTNKDGKIEVELPSDKKVYVFREQDNENQSDATYKPSKDLVLSLPQFDGKDPVYLYPKNIAKSSMDLTFKAIDGSNKSGLEGAKFVFSKTISIPGESPKTVYAQKVNAEKDTTHNNIHWVAEEDYKEKDDSFIFTSSGNGTFTINAKPTAISNLRSAWNDENMYGVAVGDKIHFKQVEEIEGYDKLPEGDFTIKEKAKDAKSSHVKSSDEKTDSYELYLETSGDDNVFTFEFDPAGLLPHTGGMGILLFVLAGASLIAVGAYAYKKQRA